MQTTKLTATSRNDYGKSAAKRLRAEGRIPAVAYGPSLENTALAVSPKEITSILGAELGRNTVIELDIEGKKKLIVLLADFQYHPVTRALLHADFKEIKENEPIDVEVPFEATGKAKGVIAGGVLRVVFRKLPVRCLPGHVPAKLTHDVTELELEHAVATKDLKLPEGVSIRLPPEQTVVAVVTEKKQPDEAELAAAAPGAAGATAAPGAAGAPAAGAAAAAAPAAGTAAGGKAAPAAGGKAGGKPNK
jgi:large subunit ribosomal protein L25